MNETVQLKLNRIMSDLEQAIYESETAINDPEKGYPYAAGYSRAAMKSVLDDVQLLKSYLENESD
jgi:hypothetical protein